VPVGSRLELDGGVDRVDGRKIWTSMTGRVDGAVAVEARALFLAVGVDHFRAHAPPPEAVPERPYNP
jgi:hypothetical protein